MDHVTLAVVLPLLHEALASSPLEWTPCVAHIGDLSLRATTTAPNGMIATYVVNLTDDVARAPKGAITVSLHRELKSPMNADWVKKPMLLIHASVTTFVKADWVPTSEASDLATVISKLFVEVQEAAATLIVKADAVTNV